jgi:hypothetical protein
MRPILAPPTPTVVNHTLPSGPAVMLLRVLVRGPEDGPVATDPIGEREATRGRRRLPPHPHLAVALRRLERPHRSGNGSLRQPVQPPVADHPELVGVATPYDPGRVVQGADRVRERGDHA